MKIVDVIPYHLSVNLEEPFGYSQNWVEKRTTTIVEIITDDGLMGYGECYGPPAPICTIIKALLKPMILNSDPFNVEVLWERMYSTLRDYGQKGIIISAISGVDIAVWDLIGKQLNRSICELIGGSFRDEVKAYATGLYYRKKEDFVEDLVNEAKKYVNQGFSAMKLKVGLGPGRDARHVAAVRDAIGKEILLMVDSNHAYTARNAIALGKQIEQYNIAWFEEPVPPEDVDGYLEVKSKLNIPIAGGEAEFTRYGFRDLLFRRAIDIAQPDCCAAGGITECRKISAIASACNIQLIPHVWGGPVAIAAALHLLATLPDTPYAVNPVQPLLEFDRTTNPIREELAERPFTLARGNVEVPKGPGLGISIRRESLERFSVK